jgi:PleD family two-component response regulator
MTFGLTAVETTDITQLLRIADERLYEGKTHGRDCIVWNNPASAEEQSKEEHSNKKE